MRLKNLLFLLVTGSLTALPQNPDVVAGCASIVQEALSCQVVQTSDKAIIQWDSFSIAAAETVQFIQPGASAVALNRVMGGHPSEIFGKLNANGQIFLINPRGILFAPGAEVHTAALVAASLDLSNKQFFDGHYHFKGHGGKVTNQGFLQGGSVVLIGGEVTNDGTIVANRANLLAGQEVAITLDQAGLLCALVEASTLSQGLETVVNNSGLITANSLAKEGGRIVLRAGSVNVQKGAKLEAPGGHVTIKESGQVLIQDHAVIDVSSAQGDAGTIIIKSESGTKFYGTLLAEAPLGKGGFIELSAVRGLDIPGRSSCLGLETGTLYIDPTNLTINHSNTDTGSFSGTNPNIWSSTNSVDTLGDSQINSMLTTANVIIDATAGSGVAVSPSINIDASGVAITVPAPRSLTLTAGSGGITMANNATIDGPGNLTLDTGATGAINLAGASIGENSSLNRLIITNCASYTNTGGALSASTFQIISQGSITLEAAALLNSSFTSFGGPGSSINIAFDLVADTSFFNNMIIPNGPSAVNITYNGSGTRLSVNTGTNSWNLNTPVTIAPKAGAFGNLIVQGFIGGSTISLSTDSTSTILAGRLSSLQVGSGGLISLSSRVFGNPIPLNITMPANATLHATVPGTNQLFAGINLAMTNPLNTSQVTLISDPSNTVSTNISAPSINVDSVFGLPPPSSLSLTATAGNITFTGAAPSVKGSAITLIAQNSILNESTNQPVIVTTGLLTLVAKKGVVGTLVKPITESDASKIDASAGGAIDGVSIDIDGIVGDNTIHYPGTVPGYVILNGKILLTNIPEFLANQYIDSVIYVKAFLVSLQQALREPGSLADQLKTLRLVRQIHLTTSRMTSINEHLLAVQANGSTNILKS